MNEMLMSMPTTGTLIHAELAIRQLLSYLLLVVMLPVLVAARIPAARRTIFATLAYMSRTAAPVRVVEAP